MCGNTSLADFRHVFNREEGLRRSQIGSCVKCQANIDCKQATEHVPAGCAQVLSTRKRKDVEVADIKVQVCLFAFDCLYLNGTMLLQQPLTERRAALSQAVSEKPGELQFALFKASAFLSLPP